MMHCCAGLGPRTQLLAVATGKVPTLHVCYVVCVVLQDLRSKLSRAEAILKLTGMCRKLETEQEKVLPFHSLAEAVPVPEQPHLAQWEAEQQQDSQDQQDQQQVVQGLQSLKVSLPQQQQQQQYEGSSQPASPGPGTQQQQQQQWTAVGLDDSGQPVSDWDYLNRSVHTNLAYLLCINPCGLQRCGGEGTGRPRSACMQAYLYCICKWSYCRLLVPMCRATTSSAQVPSQPTPGVQCSQCGNGYKPQVHHAGMYARKACGLLTKLCMCLLPGCRFFKRYNKVVLDVAAVNKERSRLEKENADLRQLLKTFLDGIRCVDVHA